MVINHLLTGMILQVARGTSCWMAPVISNKQTQLVQNMCKMVLRGAAHVLWRFVETNGTNLE